MSSSQRRIASHLLLTPQGFTKRPLITVDRASRRIVAIEEWSEGLDMHPSVEFYAGIITAGFVNAHSHLELSYLRGAIAPGGGYAAFAAAMATVRDKATVEERRKAVEVAEREMWLEGVDGVADIVNDDFSFDAKRQSPIHFRSFAEVFGLRKSNIDHCRHLVQTGEYTTLTAHSTYSIQRADLDAVCAEGGNAPLSIHFMESADEALLYRGEGRLHDWYRQVGFECDFLDHGSPARRIAECVPADRPLMLVHNCYITEEDIDTILAKRTAPTFWVLCPRSNHYISGIEPRSVELLRRKGGRICIGTDSLASNHSLSIIEELKCFKEVPLEELLRWATTNGAEALGVGDTLGEVAVGRCCGLVVISGVDFDTMTLTAKASARRVL